IGADSGTDLWRTHIASFQATVDPGADFYAVRVKGSAPLDIALSVPGAGPGQFVNAFVPAVYLYDSRGQLVAYSEARNSNDRTVTIHFQVPTNGQGRYTIGVAPSPLTPQPTQGEYALVVSGSEDDASGTAAAAAIQDPASTPAADSSSGGATRNVGTSSLLTTTAVSGMPDRPRGPWSLPVVGKPYPVRHDRFDKSRSRVPRRAGVATHRVP